MWGATRDQHAVRQIAVISIHVPHVGRDACPGGSDLPSRIFQSTCPMWGATQIENISKLLGHISIHVPHVGRDEARRKPGFLQKISIHVPHVGRDGRLDLG